MTAAPSTRRKRFARSPLPRVRLTSDDIAVIHHVANHRFLRSTHLLRLLPHRPAKKLIERMGQLYHAGYLDRPRAQLDYYDRAGSAPMVYAPGDRCSEIVSTMAGIKWRDKNRLARRPYIEHALSVADVMVAIEVSARDRKDLELLHHHTLVAPPDGRHGVARFSMAADVRANGTMHRISIVPDAVFGLRFRSTAKIAYFFLEVDRGTMAINSADLAKSSYRRKLLGYHTALKAGQHIDRFGFQNARMLTATTGHERIQSMIDVVNTFSRKVKTGRFLFAELPALIRADSLSHPWLSNAEPIRIDRPSNA